MNDEQLGELLMDPTLEAFSKDTQYFILEFSSLIPPRIKGGSGGSDPLTIGQQRAEFHSVVCNL